MQVLMTAQQRQIFSLLIFYKYKTGMCQGYNFFYGGLWVHCAFPYVRDCHARLYDFSLFSYAFSVAHYAKGADIRHSPVCRQCRVLRRRISLFCFYGCRFKLHFFDLQYGSTVKNKNWKNEIPVPVLFFALLHKSLKMNSKKKQTDVSYKNFRQFLSCASF